MKKAVTPEIQVEVVKGGFIITLGEGDLRMRGTQSVMAGNFDELTCVLQSMACTHVVELVEKIKDAPEEFPGHPASGEEADDPFGIWPDDDPETTHEEISAFRKLIDGIKGAKDEDGIATLQFVKTSPEDQVRTAARLWRNAVKNLDKTDQARATSQMRATIAQIEEQAKPKGQCMLCNGTGWMSRGTIRPEVPFSHNYMPCWEGCDGGRGHGDPIPYDPKTGKIVTTDTEDDGA